MRTQDSHGIALDAAGTPSTRPEDATFVLRGQTQHFTVSFDQTLGDNGRALADAVLATCEGDYAALRDCFGGIQVGGLPFNVFLTPGSVGGSHAGCDGTDLFCDVFSGTDPDVVRFVLVMEASEVFMANQARGWDCGRSHGEALSRVLAGERHPNRLRLFLTAFSWLDSIGNPDMAKRRPDFVDRSDNSDTNAISTGCGTLFINWLRSQLGFGLAQIIRAGGPTLAETCRRLTGWTDGFAQFLTVVNLQFPGVPSGLSTDNAFPFGPTRDGALLQGRKAGPVSVIFGQAAFTIPDDTTQARLFGGVPVIQIDPAILSQVGRIPIDGTLLREESSTVAWIVRAGVRYIADGVDPRRAHVVWDGALGQIQIGLGTLTGLVTDATDDEPIVHATVLVTPPGGAFFQLQTGDDGVYLTQTVAPGDYDVAVTQDGFVPDHGPVTITAGTLTTRRNFRLARTRAIKAEGTVTALGGPAIVGATVSLIENGASGPAGILSTPTGDDGTYTFTLDPGTFTGTYTIIAGATSFRSDSITTTIENGATLRHDFMLEALGVIAGRVTDTRGAAIAGAQVQAGGMTAPTGGSGRYRLELAAGDYTATATAHGFQSQFEAVHIDPGQTVPADFTLADAIPGALTGTVQDADTGQPLNHALVTTGTRSAQTDADGDYALADLDPGLAHVTAGHPGYLPAEQTVEVQSGPPTTADFALQSRRPPTDSALRPSPA